MKKIYFFTFFYFFNISLLTAAECTKSDKTESDKSVSNQAQNAANCAQGIHKMVTICLGSNPMTDTSITQCIYCGGPRTGQPFIVTDETNSSN